MTHYGDYGRLRIPLLLIDKPLYYSHGDAQAIVDRKNSSGLVVAHATFDEGEIGPGGFSITLDKTHAELMAAEQSEVQVDLWDDGEPLGVFYLHKDAVIDDTLLVYTGGNYFAATSSAVKAMMVSVFEDDIAELRFL